MTYYLGWNSSSASVDLELNTRWEIALLLAQSVHACLLLLGSTCCYSLRPTMPCIIMYKHIVNMP